MTAPSLSIDLLGPVARARIEFGDLTLLTGPQASGKSITLQTLKLALDHDAITRRMVRQGLVWEGDTSSFLDLYLGEGMSSIWTSESQVELNAKSLALEDLATPPSGRKSAPERVAYVPAQRVMSLRDGWTRAFGEYRAGDPYVLREFSHHLHEIVQGELSGSPQLFPKPQRFNEALRAVISEHVMSGWTLSVDTAGGQKRFVLRDTSEDSATRLPFLTWSAGQREFMPLLLGLYRLMPGGAIQRRDDLEWAIIEEPEMGLHPRAIAATMAFVLELLRRGYRVVLSTHSIQVVDIVWGLRRLIEDGGSEQDVLDMLDLRATGSSRRAAAAALKKVCRAYYFEAGEPTRDISDLDPASDDAATAGWGGLTAFSERVANVVSRVVRNRLQRETAS